MKSAPASTKGFLIRLAAEGIAPLVAGCAGALVAGPGGAVIGGVVGRVTEEAVRYFGPAIVESWLAWFRRQPPSLQAAAVEAAANLSPAEARQVAEEALNQAAVDAQVSPEDMKIALDYVAAIPAAVRRSLVADRSRGTRSVPATMALGNPRQLLGLLPQSLPPYQPGCDLPGTPYRLGELLGAGGFGAVYKASTPTLQHLAFAIKFCLDPSLMDSLRRERANLDRLQSATTGGTARIVRLYGYDFDHVTPYLVYEFVPGSDLAAHLSSRRGAEGKGLPPDEALEVIKQVGEALAFAHQRGLVHRDLKPANVLVGENGAKLTDFGIGSVTAQVGQRSRIGSTTLDQLDAAEQATLFRGAGTALYVSPEQRRGEPADPRHDLYSLGVMWYQLLVGDVTRELHPGWADELLEDHHTPPEHVEAIRACVGVMKKRPEHGGKLLEILRERSAPAPEVIPVPAPVPARPILDAVAVEPKAIPEVVAQNRREELARAIVAAERAWGVDWRWGLMLASIITGSITAVPFLVFIILTLSLPNNRETQVVHLVFRILIVVLGPVAIGFTIVAIRMGRSRLSRQRTTREALAATIEDVRGLLSLSPVSYDRDNHVSLGQAGWDLAREIEDRASLRLVGARIRYAGTWAFNTALKVYVDGDFVGEGGRRSGFDLPVRLCRGLHLLELREHLISGPPRIWREPFTIGRESNQDVEIAPLAGGSMKLQVVGSR